MEGRNRYLQYVYEDDLNEEEINNLLEELRDDNYENVEEININTFFKNNNTNYSIIHTSYLIKI